MYFCRNILQYVDMAKKIVYILWGMLAAGVLVIVIGFVGIWNGWIGYMPPVEDLQNPIDKYATQIYSSDGKVIGTWNLNKDNRIHVPYDSISPKLIEALIATEDIRFYEHSGIDFWALGRAVVKRGLFGQESAGGGSTITQQLARNVFLNQDKTWERKIEEIYIAVELEKKYSKEHVLVLIFIYYFKNFLSISDIQDHRNSLDFPLSVCLQLCEILCQF